MWILLIPFKSPPQVVTISPLIVVSPHMTQNYDSRGTTDYIQSTWISNVGVWCMINLARPWTVLFKQLHINCNDKIEIEMAWVMDFFTFGTSVVRHKLVSQMRAPLTACREPAGKL